jgi:hypothetical protein
MIFHIALSSPFLASSLDSSIKWPGRLLRLI